MSSDDKKSFEAKHWNKTMNKCKETDFTKKHEEKHNLCDKTNAKTSKQKIFKTWIHWLDYVEA